jgi:pimeloyl-ACP methyl ester carboxylesterase
VPGLALAWYDAGAGPVVVLLSGGPGDGSAYLRPFAAPLAAHFRCVLLDQRGTGRSRFPGEDGTTLHVDRLLDDLEALRRALGEERLALAGHSWGATLALLYGARYPHRVARLALLGLGPLDDEMGAVAGANLLKPLTTAERAAAAALRARRREALAAGDLAGHATLHVELVTRFSVRGWFYAPEAAARFAADFRAGYDSNPVMQGHVLRSLREGRHYARLWERLPGVAAPTLVVYGHQDFEPVVQAYRLAARMPDARPLLLNECGHVPWYEQPDALYAALVPFLRGASG